MTNETQAPVLTGKEAVRAAMQIAIAAHGDQKYGAHPYAYHLRAVEALFFEELPYDAEIHVAIWLHDTPEDTTTKVPALRQKGLPERSIDLVDAVTDGDGANRKERKERSYRMINLTEDAVILKLLDRIGNAEDCAANNPSLFQMYRKEHPTFCERLRDAPVSERFKEARHRLWERLERTLG